MIRRILLLSMLLPSVLGNIGAQNSQSRVTKFRLTNPETAMGSELYITVDGTEKKIYDEAFGAWIINYGQDVVFSGRDGSGGFENEGQSLRIDNVPIVKKVEICAVGETMIDSELEKPFPKCSK